MSTITIVGGSGAIGAVHAWMLAASGEHDVTILDSHPDGPAGKSFQQMLEADSFRFRFLEMEEISQAIQLLAEGETTAQFKARFEGFPPIFIDRLNQFTPQQAHLSQAECYQIIDQLERLEKSAIRLAQRSDDIPLPQDIIVVTVKGAALTQALGEKISRIPKHANAPVVVFANGIQPWIKPEPNFGSRHLERIHNAYACMSAIGIEHVRAGVLIKYGAMITGSGEVTVRSPFLKTQNIIAHATMVEITDDLRDFAQLYTSVGLKTDVAAPEQPIQKVIFSKLGYNLYGSMMGAIFGLTFGDLIHYDVTTNQSVRDCAAEFYAVVHQLGISLAPDEVTYVQMALQALQDNRTVISSPLQDIWQGRPTEKDQLLAAMIELAHQAGIKTPVLSAMYQLVERIESISSKDIEAGKRCQGILLERLISNQCSLVEMVASISSPLQSNIAHLVAQSLATSVFSNKKKEESCASKCSFEFN